MNITDMNMSCKTQVFKDVVSDLMHSFRTSFKRLTETQLEMRLGKIKTIPIPSEGFVLVEGRVKNLVGGKVTCALEKEFVKKLTKPIREVFGDDVESAEIFIEEFFDTFSSISKNGIFQIGLNEIDMVNQWENNLYYIQYDLRFMNESGRMVNSKVVFGIDELTAMYFRD